MAEAADAPSQPSPLPPDADTEVWPTVAELSAAARDGKPEHTDLDEVSKTEHSQSVKGGHSYYYWHRDAERRRQNGEVKPPQAARQYAAYRLRHHVLLDYQCASAADRGVGPTSRWRPATVAAFVARWTEVCTLANGRLTFHAIIAVTG